MDCDEAAGHLQEYLDRELDRHLVARIESHLKECMHCFGHAAFERNLKRLIKKKALQDHLSLEIKDHIQKKLYQHAPQQI